MNILIAGGGIIGVCAAHALLDEGHKVTLVDEQGFAAEASGKNAGWIAHNDILPLAGPKVWRHLPKWLLDPLGPLTIRPAYMLKALPYMLRFIAASTPSQIEASTLAIAALNGASMAAWNRRLDANGLRENFLRPYGQLTLWDSPSAVAAYRPVAERARGFGVEVDLLTAAQVQQKEPAFEAAVRSGRIVGGAFFPGVPHVADPQALTEALGRQALERGAQFVPGKAVSIETEAELVTLRLADGTRLAANRLVVALGAWSKQLAASAGDPVPLDTERAYNITIPSGTLGLTHPVFYDGHGFVTSPLDIGDRIGGAVEFAGLDAAPNYARVDAFLGKLRKFLPHLGEVEGTRRLCFRPSIPDSLPVIGRARLPQVIHAFGHGHYGLTQGAITAELVAGLIANRPAPFALRPYSPQRF